MAKKGGAAPTALKVLRLLYRLTPEDRRLLIRVLAENDVAWLGGYMIMHQSEVARIMDMFAMLVADVADKARRLVRSKNGSRVKKARTGRRHEEMDKAVEAGITGAHALFKFLQDNHPDLVRKGKAFIDAESMMRAYRRARRKGG